MSRRDPYKDQRCPLCKCVKKWSHWSIPDRCYTVEMPGDIARLRPSLVSEEEAERDRAAYRAICKARGYSIAVIGMR
jgi:hypothetical protein